MLDLRAGSPQCKGILEAELADMQEARKCDGQETKAGKCTRFVASSLRSDTCNHVKAMEGVLQATSK